MRDGHSSRRGAGGWRKLRAGVLVTERGRGGKQLGLECERKGDRNDKGRGANVGDGRVLYKSARVVATRAPSCTALSCTSRDDPRKSMFA